MTYSPKYIFALKLTDKVLIPCFYSGDDIVLEYNPVIDFNTWFFSKLGYLLFKKQGNILTIGLDYNLFKLYKGNKHWLNVACQREGLLKIYIKDSVFYICNSFIEAIISKIIGFEHDLYNRLFDEINSLDMSILSFYYKCYFDSYSFNKYLLIEKTPITQVIKLNSKHNQWLNRLLETRLLFNTSTVMIKGENKNVILMRLQLIYFINTFLEGNDDQEKLRICLLECFSSARINDNSQSQIVQFFKLVKSLKPK